MNANVERFQIQVCNCLGIREVTNLHGILIMVLRGSVLSGTGTQLSNIFTNNFYVTGLNESTCYDFYIQSNCIGNTSDWYGPFNACTVNVNENNEMKINVKSKSWSICSRISIPNSQNRN